jgi:hypothetical protein
MTFAPILISFQSLIGSWRLPKTPVARGHFPGCYGRPLALPNVPWSHNMPKFTGPPMDLANMRSLGVTKVDVYCACGHQASVDVSQLPGELAVPKCGFGCACSKCSKRPTETRPNWTTYRLRGRL